MATNIQTPPIDPYEEIEEGIFYSQHPDTVKRILSSQYLKIAKNNKWSISVNKGKQFNIVFATFNYPLVEIFWTKLDDKDPKKCEWIADNISRYLKRPDEYNEMMKMCYIWITRYLSHKDFEQCIKQNYEFLDVHLLKL